MPRPQRRAPPLAPTCPFRQQECRFLWDARYLATGSDCGRLYVYDVSTGAPTCRLPADGHIVNCVAPHPSLPIVATAGIDSSIKIFECSGPPAGAGGGGASGGAASAEGAASAADGSDMEEDSIDESDDDDDDEAAGSEELASSMDSDDAFPWGGLDSEEEDSDGEEEEGEEEDEEGGEEEGEGEGEGDDEEETRGELGEDETVDDQDAGES